MATTETKNRIIVALGLKFEDQALAGVRARIAALQGRFAKIGDQASRFGAATQAAGRSLTRSLSAPLVLAGGIVAKVGGDFEAAMNVLEAKSGAVGAELEAMRTKAKDLGIATQFTAAAAAEGMIEFAKAGLSASQVLDVIGPALDFAVVAQMNLGEVASITANTLAQFNLEAKQAGFVADVLSKAADASTSDVNELAESLVYAGTSASAVGMDLRETSAILAALANIGIKGSMAGTALSQSIIALASPSTNAQKIFKKLNINLGDFVDKSGRMKRPFADLMKAMNASKASVGDIMEIFGDRAGRAIVGMVNDTEKLTAATAALADVEGNAAKQAAVQMKGFNGAIKGMVSSIEGLAIAIAESGFLEFLTKSVQGITVLVRHIAGLNPRLLRTATVIAAVVASIGPVLIAVGALTKAFGALMVSASAGWLAVVGPWLAVIGVIAFLYLLIDDFFAWLEGRPSVIGYLLKDIDWPMLDSFKEWLKSIYDMVYSNDENSMFSRLARTLETIQGILNNLGRLNIDLPSLGKISDINSFGIPDSANPFTEIKRDRRNVEAMQKAFTTQTIAPVITVNVTKPASTADDIVSVLRRETAKIFGDAAQSTQPTFAQ